MDSMQNLIHGQQPDKPDYLSNLPDEMLVHTLNNLSYKRLNALRGLSRRLKPIIEYTIGWRLSALKSFSIRQELSAQWIVSKADLAAHANQALALLPREGDQPFQRLIKKAAAAERFSQTGDDLDLLGLAMKQGPEVLKAVLIMGVDPNGTGKSRSPLASAVRAGDLEATKLLLKHGAKPNEIPESRSPLLFAAATGKTEIAEVLIAAGADPNIVDNRGNYFYTPLRAAVREGHSAMVTLLLRHGAIIDDSRLAEGTTSWQLAVHQGDKDVINLLLNSQQDVGNLDKALAYAIGLKESEMTVNILLKHGADPNGALDTGWTPMHVAAYHGDAYIIRMLFNQGGKLDTPNREGLIPLDIALWRKQWWAVAQLLRLRDNFSAPPNRHPLNSLPLHEASSRRDRKSIHLLLEAGLDIHSTNQTGITPLHAAARSGDAATVALLIEKGADIEARDYAGWTPLLFAVERQNRATVRALLNAGANASVTYGNTQAQPIHRAALKGSRTIVKLLIEHGADPEAQTTDRNTPRLIASQNRHTRLLNLLP